MTSTASSDNTRSETPGGDFPSAASWSPDSWRAKSALQQPNWPDAVEYESVLKQLSGFPPLVFAGESRRLTSELARVAQGKAFLLQA
ncbi:MAG: hypothetical protein F2809_04070, partial [Actinobacteria bacterium]|nr:hypothetical protein [Actinomycetota bacterium]